jgi:hypothetical protein
MGTQNRTYAGFKRERFGAQLTTGILTNHNLDKFYFSQSMQLLGGNGPIRRDYVTCAGVKTFGAKTVSTHSPILIQ